MPIELDGIVYSSATENQQLDESVSCATEEPSKKIIVHSVVTLEDLVKNRGGDQLTMEDVNLINESESILQNYSVTKPEKLQKIESQHNEQNNAEDNISQDKYCNVVLEKETSMKPVEADNISENTLPKKVIDEKEVWSQHLRWPSEPVKSTKRKSNDNTRMPYAITSKKFKEFMDKKEAVKQKKEELRVQRKLKVNLKAKTKKINPKPKTKIKDNIKNHTERKSGGNDSLDMKENNIGAEENSNSSGPDTGSYVIVLYDEKPFPGIVKNIEGEEYEVQTMCKVDIEGKYHFKWPGRVDQIWYNKASILEQITEPRLIRRGIFECNEIEKYLPLE
ncbi:unnamed protein product [Acanthoscelides obtectus]|uniref:Uncharacterized protein n=1 Tax=Acanthoscelides obtectus TaxID=200917 RepID=A0A9P0NV79_ACAOB|nr:unnamed protein product [Acanthoscelides obtectus]CAK1672860.1 hypothetical protein AOBTE_LOCUS29119 [Acanthoscelides obtectus]